MIGGFVIEAWPVQHSLIAPAVGFKVESRLESDAGSYSRVHSAPGTANYCRLLGTGVHAEVVRLGEGLARLPCLFGSPASMPLEV